MHSHHHRFVGVDVTFDYGDMLQPVTLLTERYQAEIAILGGQMHLLPFLHQRLLAQTVSNEVAD